MCIQSHILAVNKEFNAQSELGSIGDLCKVNPRGLNFKVWKCTYDLSQLIFPNVKQIFFGGGVLLYPY